MAYATMDTQSVPIMSDVMTWTRCSRQRYLVLSSAQGGVHVQYFKSGIFDNDHVDHL